MTTPPRNHPYDCAVEAELAMWPGVTAAREIRGKHYAIVLAFGPASRFVVYPATPGDGIRGARNHIADIRSVLHDLGAIRDSPKRCTVAKPRKTSRGGQRRFWTPDHDQTPTRLSRDPWAKLAALLTQDCRNDRDEGIVGA
jgi:hypothetical protein